MIAIDQPRLYSDTDLLKQLRSFCQVARSGSITRAAEHLGLSQPSVSQQVRLLETEFAATLFERNGPRITLTPAGAHLYRLAASLVAGMDRLPDTFAEEHAGILPSELHIAAGEVASIFILPPFLKQFRDEHPGIRLFVRSSTGRDGLAWLFDYEVEFMVGGMDIISDAADFHPLFSCGFVFLVPLDHPLAGRESVEPSEAAAYPVIMSTRGTRTRQLTDFIHGGLGINPEVVVEVDGWETAKLYVEAGIGITVVPELCLTGRERVWRIPAKRYYPKRTYGVITRAGERLSLGARTFLGLMDPNFTAGS